MFFDSIKIDIRNYSYHLILNRINFQKLVFSLSQQFPGLRETLIAIRDQNLP